ncbi:MAG: signal peptidase I [Anaerolineae bacterium]|nr:signal peptidase I [Anaerolineae bacterium]
MWHDDPDQTEFEAQDRPFSLIRRFTLELFSTAVRAGILAFLIIYFIAQTHIVHGYSMEPNLHENQRIIVEKVSYRFEMPNRGDIVVIDVADSDVPLIKRVIGLPGESVGIVNGQLIVNEQVLNEPYLSPFPTYNYPITIVPDDHIFVMGDNRPVSRDSRSFGAVSLDAVRGHAWVSYWPLEDVGVLR